MTDFSTRIAQALAPQFEPAMGSWYAAGDPDVEWRLKSVDGNKIVIRACDTDDKGDFHHEVTITVSKPKVVRT